MQSFLNSSFKIWLGIFCVVPSHVTFKPKNSLKCRILKINRVLRKPSSEYIGRL